VEALFGLSWSAEWPVPKTSEPVALPFEPLQANGKKLKLLHIEDNLAIGGKIGVENRFGVGSAFLDRPAAPESCFFRNQGQRPSRLPRCLMLRNHEPIS
jgi:hypothetical protein